MPEVRLAAAPTTASPMKPAQRTIDLITLLYSCTATFGKGDKERIKKGLERICSNLASFADALALRVVQPWQGVCHALQAHKNTHAPVAAAVRRYFAKMCPFLHLIGTTANYAIIDAARMERNDLLDVVDLSGADTAQWLLLLRLFAKHPRAGTHNQILGLTIVNEEDKFLFVTGALVAREAKSLHIGFQFHPVKLPINQLLGIELLGVTTLQEIRQLATITIGH